MGLSNALKAGLAAIGWMAWGGTAAATAPGLAPAYAQVTGREEVAGPVEEAIAEASHRFGVPVAWIRAVIRVESAGDHRAVSHAGAMGLMQLMPATYAELRAQYGLGPDPFTIRDNILAGTAYLRRMHDRYGSPGFLAAYNAGPGRWDDYRAGRRRLPAETVAYLAKLRPMIGFDTPAMTQTGSEPPPLSPLEASLFASEAGRDDRPQLSDEQRRLLAIIDANLTIVPAPDSLFATSSSRRTEDPSPNSAAAPAPQYSSASDRRSETIPPSTVPQTLPHFGGLFVSRRIDRGGPR